MRSEGGPRAACTAARERSPGDSSSQLLNPSIARMMRRASRYSAVSRKTLEADHGSGSG
jgi:hypothetical protein